MEIKVRGPRRPGESAPLWEAEVEVIEWKKTHGHPADHRNIRSLFLETFGRGPQGQAPPQTLLPGTMLAMCRVEKVKVRLGAASHRWEKKDEVYHTILLLQTRPGDWLDEEKDEKKKDNFQLPDEFTCTGGEILLDQLTPASQDWKNFFRDVLRDPDHLSVHSSGLSLEGSVKLAWVENEIRALFLVTRPFSTAAELYMTLDRERMSAELRQEGLNFTRWQRSLEEFGAAFRRLSDLLRNESSVAPQPATPPRHRWLALDLTNREGVPQFRWELSSPQAGARPPLRLARGEAQLLLSDQPPGEQDVPPRSLMNASPELLIKEEGGHSFTLAFEDGERDDERGKFTLKGTPLTPDGALKEEVTLSGGVTAYDPLTTATHLRRQHQLPGPDETLDEISPAVLWGFVPLEDGWAQLPFLNLTSQIYFNALRTTADLGAQADAAAPPLLFGAATFGNDAPEVYKHTDGEQPWSVTLLNGAGFSGFWRFDLLGSGAAARWQLRETLLEVYDPDVALNGFLWLGTETPTTEDALPNLDNWLEGARMLPLRTPRPGERFPSPFVLRFDEITFKNEFKEEPSGRKFSRPLLSSWKYTYDSNEEPIKKDDGKTKPAGEPDYSTLETLLIYGFWGLRPPAGGDWPALNEEQRRHFERRRSEFWQHLPLVWRRHPRLPAVQALPLTQNKVPPNYPSPSRQLAPFELPLKAAPKVDPGAPASRLAVPDRWQFGVGVTPGAAVWPRLDPSAPARPAAAWARAKYLWLASLGIPGLVHDPAAAPDLLPDPDRFLPAQYVYTLPYTDEPNALAQLPKDEKPNQAGAPVAEAPEERPVLPLAREDYAGHWEGLGEKALLARPDADEALSKNGNQTVVKGLVEPFEWPVSVSLSTVAYPGAIKFEGDGSSIPLSALTALRGLHAGFSLAGNRLRLDKSPAATFNVTAGSMAAQGADGRQRDQRGLSRGATLPPTPSGLLKTPLRHEGGQVAHEFMLLTLMRPLSLSTGKGADWQFWFRDVPVADANGTFDRRAAPFLSEFARDVNDPAATSSKFAHLRGYEWRLAESGGPQPGRRASLPLFGFDFYPLTLEKLITADDIIRRVELVGRIQLPSGEGGGDAERPELGNAVSVRFDADSEGRLRLSRISSGVNANGPDEIFGEWPLAATKDDFAPSLRLHSLEFGAETGFKIKLRVSLDFYYFNTRWEITKNSAGAYKEVSLDPGQTGLIVDYDPSFLKEMGDEQVSFSRVRLELKNLKPESLKVFLSFRWGRAGDAPQTQSQATALQARADVTVRLIPAPEQSEVPEIAAQLTHTGGAGSFELKLSDNKSLVAGALQLEFTDLPAAAKGLHLLPGMRLSRRERVKGFAVMAFEVSGGSGETRSRLRFTYGGLELIIPCEWGEQLQADGPRDPRATPPFAAAKERVFGSSAGRLYAGYTLNGTSGGGGAQGAQNVVWQSSLLLNGSVELKNLISWPAPTADLPADLLPVRFPVGKKEAKDIVPQDKATLGKVAQLLITKPALRLSVEGHADSEGGESHNLDLARDRARNVREAVVGEVVNILKPKPADKKKVEESFGSRIAAVGFGQILPRDSNTTEQGRLNNRRVEFHPLLFQIPAANPATDKPPLSHTRHTLRVLLNQHEIPQDALDKGAPTLLFNFNGAAAWQFLAVVEHQLVDVVAGRPMGDTVELKNDRRWTAVQEVRFASPSKFALFLDAFRTSAIKTLKLEKNLDKPVALNASQTTAGYHHTRFLELLFKERGGSNEIDKLKETLVVEASATYWLLPHARPGGSFTNLQYLPLATQRGILSVPGDFAMPEVAPPPPGQQPTPQTPWVLITLPFLGRLQAVEKDLPAGPFNEQTSYLQVDPIYFIEKSRAAGGALPEAPRALSSWGDAEARSFRMSHFDTARFRRLKRLDLATSEESWFRLQHPPSEAAASRPAAAGPGGRKLPSVMATLPTDSPGRLSRPAMLGRLFDEFRNALPPEASDGRVADVSSRDDLVWRRNNLFLAQGLSDLDDELRFYGFFYAGVQIHSSRIPGRDGEPARFAAATMLPANISSPGGVGEPEEENPVPVSFTVSPYLGVEQRPHTPGAGADLLLTFAELFCLDPGGGSLDFVASQVWQGGQLPPEGGEEVIKLWGREVSSRVASDSPVAVLRMRRVRELELRDIIIEYEFFTLGQGPGRFALPKETRRIRHSVERLRFAEGQFGGSRMPPAESRAFELAPPQTRGVQPLYLNPELPSDFPRDARFRAWTWGLSALRFSVQLTEGKVGIAGEPAGGAATCAWWSVTSHHVQFVVPSKPDSLLPKKFRARSIHSLLPAAPNLPLPDLPQPEPPNEPGPDVARLAKLQPVLPGAFNYLLIDARAGANFLFRHFLLRQELDGRGGGPASVASGAVSVQHRMPRPVSLPPNRHGQHAHALQTWGSVFDLLASAEPGGQPKTLRLTPNPADNALLLFKEDAAPPDFARGLEVELTDPEGGLLPQQETSKFVFHVRVLSDRDSLGNWVLNLELIAEGRSLSFRQEAPVGGSNPTPCTFFPAGATDEKSHAKILREFLAGLAHGAAVHLRMTAQRDEGLTVKNYRQTLNFPLRVALADRQRPPLRPVYLQFEDPEYNRRLSSLTAQVSRVLALGPDRTVELTLASDRREYNPNSSLLLVLARDRADVNLQGLSVLLKRVDTAGVGLNVKSYKMDFQGSDKAVFNLIDLAAKEVNPPFTPGETLLLSLTRPREGASEQAPFEERFEVLLELRVDIVSQPVTPTSEAGYALLRRRTGGPEAFVECVRFAWSPQPQRIDLVNPDDLLSGLVRRRAIFQWLDVERFTASHEHALQKVAPSGATHFPLESDSRGPT